MAIVGLGNPTPNYALTRHNLGFLIVDYLEKQFHSTQYFGDNVVSVEDPKKICYSLITRVKIKDFSRKEIFLVKPQTYMNKSGNAILALKSRFCLKKEDIVVINDDVDLAFGSVQLRNIGGSGSHNGLRSIVDSVGKDFCWMRAGIANEEYENTPIEEFVLSEFNKKEMKQLPNYLTFASHAIFSILKNGFTKTINDYNKKHFCSLEKK